MQFVRNTIILMIGRDDRNRAYSAKDVDGVVSFELKDSKYFYCSGSTMRTITGKDNVIYYDSHGNKHCTNGIRYGGDIIKPSRSFFDQ